MTDLGPRARDLLAAGRSAYRAQPDDRERIASALRARLGPESLPPSAAQASALRLARWQLVGASIGTGLAATLVTFWALGTQPTARPAQRTAAVPSSAQQPTSAPEPVPDAPTRAEQPARPTAARSGARPDSLAQEVQLLARATRSMRAGQTARALSTLDEHQRRFPNGALSEERRTARAQALCALGRVDEGRAEQARLPPRSPSEARAARACDEAAERIRAR
jgi:hypothetical protein